MNLKNLKAFVFSSNIVSGIYYRIKYFFFQFPFFAPLGIIYDLDAWIKGENQAKGWFFKRTTHWLKQIYDSEILVYKKPNHFKNELNIKFEQNRIIQTYAAGICYLNGAFVFSSQGVVISRSNFIFDTFTHNFNISTLRKSRLFKPFHTFSTNIRIYNENVALLASSQSHNHYHWVMDTLPRIHLLADLLPAISCFIVPDTISQRQIETLEKFGIKETQLIKLKEKEKIFCTRLYVPSLPGSEGYSPKWVVDFLKQTFLPNLSVQEKNRKIYISRKDAPNRKIVNEKEVIEYMESNGFEIIEMSKYTFQEQLEVCASASTIISLHGASLTNIFVASNCKILEIFSPDYFRTDCYYTLSNLANLEYWYLEGSCFFNAEKLNWGDIYLDLKNLKETLAKMQLHEN